MIESINLPDLLVVLRGIHVHAVEDLGPDELLVRSTDLGSELTWLLMLLPVVVVVLLVVALDFPAGVDDGLQETHCSEAHIFGLQGLSR